MTDLYWRAPYPHELRGALPTTTIQAIDTADETIYVLRRPDHEPVSAHWPGPLLEIAPEAVRVPAYGLDIDHPPAYQPKPAAAAWKPLKLSAEQKVAAAERKKLHLTCEDCKKRLEPGDYRPMLLYRKDPKSRSSSTAGLWDATKQKWVKRPRRVGKKRNYSGTARRGGRRARVWDLCNLCADRALLERKSLEGKERLRVPKKSGRPRLMSDQQLRDAYTVYLQTNLSRREVAERVWKAAGNGTWGGYQFALHSGWRRLNLPLTRTKGEQIGMSKYGTDGTLSRSWKVRCKARTKNGERCTQWVRRDKGETGSQPAEDGLCYTHAHARNRKIAA